MVLTVPAVLDALRKRESDLVSERQRIVDTAKTEVARVDVQLAATRKVLIVLADDTKAALVDSLLSAIGSAGVHLSVGE